MQPGNQTVWPGTNVAFSVAVMGAPPLFYYWQKNGTNLTDAVNVTGSAARILHLANISAADAATYSVIVSNSLGSVISTGALLTVISPPVFQSVAKTNNSVRLVWSGISGLQYQLQFKGTLGSTNWNNLGSPVFCNGTTVTALDALGTNAQRFYRVVLLH